MPQEAIDKAYQRLSEKFEMPPIEQFQKDLESPEERKKAYDRLSQSFDMSDLPFEVFDKQATPETGLFQAAMKGFSTSNIGAALMTPEWKFQPSGLSESLATSAGKLAGDIPSMIAGGVAGTLGGLVTGPGAVLAGGAGSFALPRAIEAYQRGEPLGEAVPEVIKSGALGALTAGVGGVVGKLAPALKVPAEIGALTIGGAGLEGRLPTSDDLIQATALVYGLKFASSIAGKIRGARSRAAESQLNVDEQLQSIQDIINQEVSKKATTEPEFQIPPEQQAIKQRMLLEAAQDRMLRRSQRGKELLKRGLATKEILGEPGKAPSPELETRLRLEETPEKLRQERVEDEEIQAAISRERGQQRLVAETEPLLPTRGAGGKMERAPTDVGSLKEAMTAAAERAQQAKGLPEALKQTLSDLSELFKPGGELRTGFGFSEEAYQRAKGHIDKAWEAVRVTPTGRLVDTSLSHLLGFLNRKVGDNIYPYLVRYLEDKNPNIGTQYSLNKTIGVQNLPKFEKSTGEGQFGQSGFLHRAVRAGDNVIVGKVNDRHEDILDRYHAYKFDKSENRGFIDRRGRFLTRTEALQFTKGLGDVEAPAEGTIARAARESIKALSELFKPGGELRSGAGFSEESYQKAKPHFQKAWEAYKVAGRDFREFAYEMLSKGGENLKPFLDQFQREQATAVRQNLTQQTTEKVNQASQSTPEERTPQVEDIQWLSRIIFTPQRAVSTKFRSGFGKTNIEVNLEHPKAQDIASTVLREDSKTSQIIQNEVTHATNTESEFYKGISRLPQGLSSRVYSAERGTTGEWFKKVTSNPANLTKVPEQYRKTVTSLLAHYKLTDSQVKGDPARGIPSYAELMEQAGATQAQISSGLKKLQEADVRLRAGNNIFRDFKSYLSFVTRHLSMDPVQVQIKSYMNEHPELFPKQIKETIKEQLLVARGEKSWIEDKVIDGIWNWFGRPSYKGFTAFSQLSRRGEANLKLGYRPISAFVDLAHSVANTLIKREGQLFWQSLKRTADFMNSKEGKKFIKDEEEAGSLQIGLDVDYAGRPVPKEALWKPLGLRSASEVKQRQFALSFAYQNALARGMTEPVAREYARRMLHLTQGTYVLSGMRQFMRAPIAKTLFQFKEYIGRTFELMHTFSKREWAEYIAFNMAMSGPRGLILFAKSIPMLAMIGVLDKVEDALNTYKGAGKELVSGLPGAAGVDVAGQATLQVAPQPEDAGGVLISDAIKIFKNFILPLAGPGRYLTARAIKEFGGDTLRSIIPEFRNIMDIWDSIVSQGGWVHNNEGKPAYQLNSGWERVLKGLGASTIEENKLRVAERLRVGFEQKQKDSIKFLLRVAAKDKLTGDDATEAIRELGKLGIQSQSIENAFKQRLLDPKIRALLKTRLSQKARVLEFYEFE